MAATGHDAAQLQDEIRQLEAQLSAARAKLAAAQPASTIPDLASHTHFLLLLSDSALPLGSFAFSSGLESYLAHTPPRAAAFSPSFLPESISSLASSTLPFVLAAHRDPTSLPQLDDELDAAIMCAVGRRASVAQGRALLGIWDRSFRGAAAGQGQREHVDALRDFSALLRSASGSTASKGCGGGEEELPAASAHLPPLFGAVSRILGLDARQTAYVFVMGHVKALVSAAVRASLFGPYQAQKVLAGENVRRMIDTVIEREWHTPVHEAGQTSPVLDLWIGRHELLYSRIFNS